MVQAECRTRSSGEMCVACYQSQQHQRAPSPALCVNVISRASLAYPGTSALLHEPFPFLPNPVLSSVQCAHAGCEAVVDWLCISVALVQSLSNSNTCPKCKLLTGMQSHQCPAAKTIVTSAAAVSSPAWVSTASTVIMANVLLIVAAS